MSATGRSLAANTGHRRHPDDFYETPAWCTDAILPFLGLTKGSRVLEPAAGTGAIVEELRSVQDVKVFAFELSPERYAIVGGKCPTKQADFLEASPTEDWNNFDLVITNPPFALAMEFVRHSMAFASATGRVAMLLRLNWLSSIRRAQFLRTHCPDVYVLPRRPSFTGGGTDATDYGWFVWHGSEPRSEGTLRILEVE